MKLVLGRLSNDVKNFRSEVGVLFLNSYNRDVLTKMLDDNHLLAHHLFTAQPHIFVSKTNPLAKKDKVKLSDLENFPYLSYDQGIAQTPSTFQKRFFLKSTTRNPLWLVTVPPSLIS